MPVGIFGTAWSYLRLKEVGKINRHQKLDVWGNVAFGVGLTLILVGATYGLLPYGTSSVGWANPWVIASLVGGGALLLAFPFIEMHVKNPMFELSLFKINAFTTGNIAGFLASIGRGGVQIMLIILLQGIWLPLHGYAYSSTPFWSGIYITPMLIGFVVMGPISGRLADRRGSRGLATAGMVVTAAAFILLSLLSYNFIFWEFGLILFVMGIGGGLFASPNTAMIMSSAPPEHRGAASGMRATLQNVGQTVSIAIFFSIVLSALSGSLPGALSTAVTNAGAPQLSTYFSGIPPTSALFAAFLGYNPIGTILAGLGSMASSIPSNVVATLTGQTFFPDAIAPAFMSSLRIAFYLGAILSIIAAIATATRSTSKTPKPKADQSTVPQTDM